jgi:REP element-mobilizing transposase RayT
LANFDYSSSGAYFVTICAHKRALLFGSIVNGNPSVSAIGKVIQDCWNVIPLHFPNIVLDSVVVMPNHLHGIVVLNSQANAINNGPQHAEPLPNLPRVATGSIGAIVRSFKSAVTKIVNEQHLTAGIPVWQRNYHERVIRHEVELNNIRQYIEDNPKNWENDSENPAKALI